MLEYLQKIFTPETVTVILSILSACVAVIKMAVSLKNSAKAHIQNVQEIALSVKDAAKDSAKEIVVKEIKPFLDELKIVKNSLQTFSKVFLLMQENTPNAKLAIMQLIEDLGQVDVKEVQEVREQIVAQVEAEEKKEEQKQEKLAKISEGRY